jgi:hypothetical protein
MDLSEKSCEKLRLAIDLYVQMVYPLLRGRNFDKNERGGNDWERYSGHMNGIFLPKKFRKRNFRRYK